MIAESESEVGTVGTSFLGTESRTRRARQESFQETKSIGDHQSYTTQKDSDLKVVVSRVWHINCQKSEPNRHDPQACNYDARNDFCGGGGRIVGFKLKKPRLANLRGRSPQPGSRTLFSLEILQARPQARFANPVPHSSLRGLPSGSLKHSAGSKLTRICPAPFE